MDPEIYDDIRSRLRRYENAVREIKEHAGERSSFGRYRAGAPYFEQYSLRAALDAANGCDPGFLRGARDRYDRITRELSGPPFGSSRAYREELSRDLRAYIELYRTTLCCNELGMGDLQESAYPSLREEIGVLIRELERDLPLADLVCELTSLDAAREALAEEDMAGIAAREDGGGTAAGCPYREKREKRQAGVRLALLHDQPAPHQVDRNHAEDNGCDKDPRDI